jgi:hypothetical protein
MGTVTLCSSRLTVQRVAASVRQQVNLGSCQSDESMCLSRARIVEIMVYPASNLIAGRVEIKFTHSDSMKGTIGPNSQVEGTATALFP